MFVFLAVEVGGDDASGRLAHAGQDRPVDRFDILGSHGHMSRLPRRHVGDVVEGNKELGVVALRLDDILRLAGAALGLLQAVDLQASDVAELAHAVP